MFELAVAWKYLVPRRRQLSVSIISLVSVCVIALVVWLMLVFFSITSGVERHWISKLVAVAAPVRMMPTPAYYNSYYYQVDLISHASGYRHQSLTEKRAGKGDPYDPMLDSEVPASWPAPDLAADGTLRDLVGETFSLVQGLSTAFPTLRAQEYETAFANLQLRLERPLAQSVTQPVTQTVPQATSQSAALHQSLLIGSLDPQQATLKESLLPATQQDIQNILNILHQPGETSWSDPSINQQDSLHAYAYLVTHDDAGIHLPSLPNLSSASASMSPMQGEFILLPKAFRDAGVLMGDRGYLAYQALNLSGPQEQRLPVYVAGFYDPGMLPIGGKLALMDPSIPSLLLSAYQAEDLPQSSGIHVHIADFHQADRLKEAIQRLLREKQLDQYWKVETFREYEFTKELLQQLRSDRHLSLVIAAIILLIACSNIISMQLLLVHDKKKEIAILRAMGASSLSIMTIFGCAGLVMGLLGSLLGTLAALITLSHLDTVLHFISILQGYELFHPTFYGTKLPSELSFEGVALIWGATALLSLIAGVIPAVKASCMSPSHLLRTE